MAGDLLGDMDVEYAQTVADRAIRSMSQQSVPATPSNFSVWFIYAMGTSVALRKTIDILIGNKRKFDASINHELYVTYVNPPSDMAAIRPAIYRNKKVDRKKNPPMVQPADRAMQGRLIRSGGHFRFAITESCRFVLAAWVG